MIELNKNMVIGVIFGGPSGEYEVSCHSAQTIINVLLENGYHPFPIGVSKQGHWYGPVQAEDVPEFTAKSYRDHELILPQYPGRTLYDLQGQAVVDLDVVIPIIHGYYGEDGHLQALLEMARIPYVGSNMSGSVVGMDKVLMRDIFKAHGIAQTDYCAVLRHDLDTVPQDVLDRLEKRLPYPMFVKPACAGSSVGISKVHNRQELLAGLELAAKYDPKLIVEKGVNAREIETAVLGNYYVDIASPGEIITEGVFYDYDSKYILNNSETKVPADLDHSMVKALEETAKKVYDILCLSGFCRVDFFIDKDSGRLLLNEVNTLPGFTRTSMYPMMWKASGLPLITVLEELVNLAFEKYEDTLRNYVVFGGDADGK
jgi:D-alanine-D-alanine ligase